MQKLVLMAVAVAAAVAIAPGMARGATTVAVFDDPAYVDSSGGSGAESDTVQASLDSLGYVVKPFTGVTASDFSRGLAGAKLLAIPEMENGDLTPALTPQAIHTLRTYVATGGGLLVFYNPVNLINTLFGYSIATGVDSAAGTRTSNVAGTSFGGGPASVPELSATTALNGTTLPGSASIMYVEAGTNAWVTAFQYGAGEVVHLGWDWFNAKPLGAQDGGWLSVLNRAAKDVAGNGCTISGTPGVDSLTGTSGPDRICGFGGTDQISAGAGMDVILAGRGNDVANGGAGNDQIVAGPGADVARGNDGKDVIDVRDGVRGNDRAVGGAGSDTCRRDRGDAISSC